MKITIIRFIACLIIMLVSSPLHAINADDVNKAIRDKGAGWVAGETPVSKLTPSERKRLLPMKPVIRPGTELKSYKYHAEEVLPAHFDWRNVDGHNYITSVKDQGKCGACYAFTTTAALESSILINSHTPDTELDLSEQSMISCDTKEAGCDGGFFESSIDFLKDVGAPLESCYPYISGENGIAGDPAGCDGWRQNVYRVTSFQMVSYLNSESSVEAMKSALVHNGPLMGAFVVYTDFLYYKSGIYRHVSGDIEAGHDVLIVGYDDEEQCWIIKNSWGPDWGENGYFRVAMGTNESYVETEVFSIEYATVPGPSFVLSPSEIDFGMLFLPDNPFQIFSFTITNNGSVPLTGFSFDVTNPKFSVSGLSGQPLESAASEDLQVTYTGLGEPAPDAAELDVFSTGVTRNILLSGQSNTRPAQPENLWPPNGAILINSEVTLHASEFFDADGDAHEASRWIIEDSSGASVYSGNFDAAGKNSFKVPSGILRPGAKYSWQVIYRDGRGAEASASALTSFSMGREGSGGGNCFISAATDKILM
jgi:hypothetical protein